MSSTSCSVKIIFSSDWKSVYKETEPYLHDGLKLMVYCQAATLAMDKVKPFSQSFLSEMGFNELDAVSLTGSDGIMMKSFLVDLFSSKISSDVCNLAIIAGTSAMNCGISSNLLHYIIHIGFPRPVSEMVQTLGRLCCGPLPQTCQDRIHYVLSLAFFIPLFLVASSHKNVKEKFRQVYELKQVVRLLLSPSECYHVAFSAISVFMVEA
eukprot:scaffold111497_cov63-Attheya_sp.AAC.1